MKRVAFWLVAVAVVVVPWLLTLGLLLGDEAPPAPVPVAQPDEIEAADDPRRALGLLRFAGGQCTGTVVAPALSEGHVEIMSARHCMKKGQKGTFKLNDGRVIQVEAMVSDPRADIAWLRSIGKGPGRVPMATLAKTVPAVRAPIWHAGFGIHIPGNLERGRFDGGADVNGQYRYFLSVSPGDSGGGIFLDATGELLSPVCCTTRLSGPGSVWGGGSLRAWQIRPSGPPAGMDAKVDVIFGNAAGHPSTALVPMLMIAEHDRAHDLDFAPGKKGPK